MSLLSNKYLRDNENILEYHKEVKDASGNIIPIIGKMPLRIKTPDGDIEEQILIHKNEDIDIGILIGMNILRRSAINLYLGIIEFKPDLYFSKSENLQTMEILNRKIINISNNLELKGVREQIKKSCIKTNTDFNQGMNREGGETVSETDHLRNGKNHFNLHLLEEIKILPNRIMGINMKIHDNLNGETLLLKYNNLKQGIVVPNIVTIARENRIKINIANISNLNITLPQGTKMCSAYILNNEEEKIQVIESQEEFNFKPLIKENINCGNKAVENKLLEILNNFRKICWMEGEPLGRYTGDKLKIKLTKNELVNKPPYRIPHAKELKLEEKMKEMQEQGIIKKSKSSYNSPLICVKKPNGDIRPCIDYRELNKIIEPINFPIPRIDDLINSLDKAKIISSLDLASAYHQCEIEPRDTHKTAFTFKNSKWEYQTIPFGLKTAPAFFSRLISDTLFDLIGTEVICYLDDILIFAENEEEHLERIYKVLQKLEIANIKIKMSKCAFFTKEVKFLGYIISEAGMAMDVKRAEAIEKMESPKNKKQLQALLGAINYYRTFIENLAKIAEPLYQLLRKNVKFKWTEEQEKAAKTLKSKLMVAPILKFPNFNKPFIIYTDASLTGIGACLMQIHGDKLHPLAFVSRSLNPAQKSYAATKREALALIFALEQFRHLILCYPTHVYTDHLPLVSIFRKETKDATINRWTLLAQEYEIQIHYVPGKENILADALSRLPMKKKTLENFDDKLVERINTIETELYSYLPEKIPWTKEELKTTQENDENCLKIKNIMKNPKKSSETILKFKVIKNILYVYRVFKRPSGTDEILVPYIPNELMDKAFKVIHRDTTAGHQGFERTLQYFRRNFYNTEEKDIIKNKCETCTACIRAKSHPSLVPIKKYPIPLQPFDTISTDILGPLPITINANKFILVVRDFTTRYSIITALKNKETESIIIAFRHIIANYGPSTICISDNGKEFTSEKFKKFLSFYNTKKIEIAPFHPSSQGLAERINKEINKLLRIYTNELRMSDWDELLPTIQLTINNTFNSSIRETPFYALYGYDSSTIAFVKPKINYKEDDLNYHLKNVSEIREHCRNALLKSQIEYTVNKNNNRKEKEIQVGQRVFAKLNKHFQHRKLNYPISGPFMVEGKKGNAFILKAIHADEKFTVHPDEIILKSDFNPDNNEINEKIVNNNENAKDKKI